MNNNKKILKYTVFLVVLGLIAGVLLGAVNALTSPIIEERAKEQVVGALRKEFDYADYSFGKKVDYPESSDAIQEIFFAFNEDGSLAAVIYQTAVPGYEKTGFVRCFVEIKVDGTFGKAKMISHDDTPSFADKIMDHDFGMADQNVDSYSPVVAGVTPQFTLGAIIAGFDAAADHFKTIKADLGGVTND
ncbi:MAG: hypothetical protein WC006_00335 [Bacilli bacterium]